MSRLVRTRRRWQAGNANDGTIPVPWPASTIATIVSKRLSDIAGAALSLTPPGDQVGGVEALAAQQGSDAAGVGRGGISLG